jgi:hypothetical protein
MALMLVILMERIKKSIVEMGSGGMIYIPSFMKIGKGVEGILRSCLSNLKGCNAGITDGRDL